MATAGQAMSEAAVAFAELQAAAEPGDTFVIHAEDCPVDEHDEHCECEPLVLVCVAEAATA